MLLRLELGELKLSGFDLSLTGFGDLELKAQVAAIAASIKEWGWTSPALVGEDGGLIAGHARVLAARQLGIAEIPVMVAAGGARRRSGPMCWPTISWRSPAGLIPYAKNEARCAASGALNSCVRFELNQT